MPGWFAAAKAGDIETIRALAPTCQGQTDGNGNTALMVAARHNRATVVQLLVTHEIGCTNDKGLTALLMAVAHNHAECARILFSGEGTISAPTGLTPLQLAFQRGAAETAQVILEQQPQSADVSLLRYAVMSGVPKVVQLLRQYVSLDRKAIQKAKKDAKGPEMLSFLEGLERDARQQHYGNVNDLSSEVDRLLSITESAPEMLPRYVGTSGPSRSLSPQSPGPAVLDESSDRRPAVSLTKLDASASRSTNKSVVFSDVVAHYPNDWVDTSCQTEPMGRTEQSNQTELMASQVRAMEDLQDLSEKLAQEQTLRLHLEEELMKTRQELTRLSRALCSPASPTRDSSVLHTSFGNSDSPSHILPPSCDNVESQMRNIFNELQITRERLQNVSVFEELFEALKNAGLHLIEPNQLPTLVNLPPKEQVHHLLVAMESFYSEHERTKKELDHSMGVIAQLRTELAESQTHVTRDMVENVATSPLEASRRDYRAEYESLECKQSILLSRVAELESELTKRQEKEGIVEEKLRLLQMVQDNGYQADPAYRLLQQRCSTLEARLQESDIIVKDMADELAAYKRILNYTSSKPEAVQNGQAAHADELVLTRNFFDDNRVDPLTGPTAFRPNKEKIQKSRSEGSRVPLDVSQGGTTPLMIAVQEGNLNEARGLLRYAGMSRADGTTALMLAAELGALDLVELLLPEEGDMFRWDGATALTLAQEKGHNDVVELLKRGLGHKDMDELCDVIALDGGSSALMLAASMNDSDGVQALLPTQAKLRDKSGRTALMYAADSGATDAVTLLINLEAGEVDNTGLTALMLACIKGHIACVELLAEREAQITDWEGRSALWYAVQRTAAGISQEVVDDIIGILCLAGAT
ncbi:Ankyrin repeat protein 1 [Giardia muris]|uniref:Ankyrin repeat protein 1 n=1 Tax=Giardia muris TaxID=5742 RepID=A0A4Z1T699_GIAMU|nr:Ankyrin repeat protein 1 [Giardia muris]|eukprot:TNJ29583.1 Ankyrin repeat protein 1 [Giardia muris]